MSNQGTLGRRFPEVATMIEVVGALLMRDMQTRFGNSKFGFLLYLMIPFVHVAVIVVIYRVLGRVAPLGNDPVVFFSLAVCAFVLCAYPYAAFIRAPLDNKPLLYFPRVKLIDLLVARAILEILGAIVTCCTVFLVLLVAGFNVEPHDLPVVLAGFAAAIYIGVAFALPIGILVALWTPLLLPANLLRSLFWATSGVFFLPGMLPQVAKDLVTYFPLLHAVELVRVGYYADYVSPTLDLSYMFWAPTTALGYGFLLHQLVRRYIK